jgi:hypothetical protein
MISLDPGVENLPLQARQAKNDYCLLGLLLHQFYLAIPAVLGVR